MKIIKISTAFIVSSVLLLTLINPAFTDASVVEVSIIPPTFSFQKDLKLKDNNVDVFFLQIVLNADPDTAISNDANFGAPGHETTYFGGFTQAAVIRFQNKYRDDILTPLGLTEGTGYVGPSTRAKLNEVLNQLRLFYSNSTTTSSTSTTSTDSTGQTSTTDSGSNISSGASSAGLLAGGVGVGASAAGNQLLKPFGGQIYFVDYYSCSCSGGIMVWIKDKVPPFLIKKLVYQAGVSRLNSYYNLFIPGNQTVGSYTPIPTVCLQPSGNSCIQQYNDGLITPNPFPGVGTTLTPSGA